MDTKELAKRRQEIRDALDTWRVAFPYSRRKSVSIKTWDIIIVVRGKITISVYLEGSPLRV